jgi:cobalamin synthase
VKPWVVYSLVRLGLFAVLLVILVPLLSALVPAWVSAVIAALIAMCVSYLVLGRQRRAVATSIAEARETRRERSADERAEDDALEGDRRTER